jgi:basic membrane lipoprotein Med (substrate-binding protein (PBP1-ABC) superfamily)
MRTIATTAATFAALALLAAGGSSSASTLPGNSPGTAAPAAAKFSGCLAGDDSAGGSIHRGLNKVSWQGMMAAAAAEPNKIQVRYLLAQDAADYAANISAFIGEKCGLIVTVGPTMAPATEAAAKANPKAKFAIVACSYQSHCLTGKKLKNITSVKGTATAVKTVVLAAANGT